MIFSHDTYKILKYLTQIVLPAIATFYFALAGIWGFPCGEEVVGTIAALTTLLGVTLGVGTYRYNKLEEGTDGAIVIDADDDISGSAYVQFDKEIEALKNKNELVLKVVTNDERK